MKTPLATARRGPPQANRSLGATRLVMEDPLWPEACLQAEQTAKPSLKTYLCFDGRRRVTIHPLRVLVQECSTEDARLQTFTGHDAALDYRYLQTRRPDAPTAPAVAFEYFTGPEARQGPDHATETAKLVQAEEPAQ